MSGVPPHLIRVWEKGLLAQFGRAGLHAFSAWALTAPLLFALVGLPQWPGVARQPQPFRKAGRQNREWTRIDANWETRPLRASALVFTCRAFLPVLVGADVDAWIAAGLEAEKRHEPAVALEHFRRAAEVRTDDAFLQQKIARQLSDSAFLERDDAARRRLATEALPHSRRAVEARAANALRRDL